MDLLSEGDAPDHRVDPFVRVVFCHLREVEVQLQNRVVHFEHALESGHQQVALFDV
jgi:hypothetical protein